MKVLFVGGTNFVGRQMVEDALIKGFDVSILQRGKTNRDLFLETTKYFGDRLHIKDILPASERWDIVIDTCGYHPEVVRVSAEFFKGRTELYIFISTGSVYADFSNPHLTETSKLSQIKIVPPIDVVITPQSYGPLKVLCEQQVLEVFGEQKTLILRPTIIVGPHDPTKRFNYWLESIATQTQIEVPEDQDAPIQFIDVRALSQFTLESLTKNTVGIYNIMGPRKPMKFLEFIEMARGVLNPALKITYTSNRANSYPLYISDLKQRGLFKIDGQKAFAAGLKDIGAEETILFSSAFIARTNESEK